MNIVRVSPISRGAGLETLTYFSKHDFPTGVLITVPLGRRQIPGLVLDTAPVSSHKDELKRESFALRKINSPDFRSVLLPSFVAAAQEAARFQASTTGAVLHSLLPLTLLNKLEPISTTAAAKVCSSTHQEFHVMQASPSERISHYRTIIREAFARGSSLFVLAPTTYIADKLYQELQTKMEDYTFLLHSRRSKPALIKTWQAALASKHPIVAIGTTSFLSLPREDIETIIIEEESSPHYKQRTRPYLDVRQFVRILAYHQCARVVAADTVLSVETLWQHRLNESIDIYPTTWRYRPQAQTHIIDMKQYRTMRHEPVRVFSEDIKGVLSEAKQQPLKIILTTTRRGLHPTTVCDDCGTTLTCTSCHYPLVLHENENSRVHTCSICGQSQPAIDRCRNCQSWRLRPLGIGIDLVAEHLENFYADLPLFILDGSRAHTPTQAAKLAQAFYSASGSAIFLTTGPGLAYLDQSVDITAVVSIDSLLSLPDLGTSKQAFDIIIHLQQLARYACLVQTRLGNSSIIKHALSGNVREFYEHELAVRQEYYYPPFSTLIKLTIAGHPDSVSRTLERVREKLVTFNPEIYPSFASRARGKHVYNILLTLPINSSQAWINDELLQILESLPPAIAIDVAPRSIR
jgi:primosomal protein N' (replication factor Y)